MADIPVTSKGSYRGAYDGPPIEEHERHRPKHNFSNFVFRTMTALATAAAFIVVLESNEHTTYRGFRVGERWQSFAAYK
jgi:hypothetical protein